VIRSTVEKIARQEVEGRRERRIPSGIRSNHVCRLPEDGQRRCRACTPSFTGPSGVRHGVEVTAETLYERAALGLALLRKDGWTEAIAPGTELEVQVRQPAARHTVTLAHLRPVVALAPTRR
jgi:hypothetical protein